MSEEDAEVEADAEGSEEEGEGKKKKKFSGKKLVLFVALPLLLLGGGGAGVMFSGLLDGDEETEAAGEDGEATEEDVAVGEEESHNAIFYDLPEMLVNLNTAGRQASFLKIQVSLELGSPDAVPLVEAVLPRIVDNFQVYLRELRPDELSGTKGIFRLKEELLVRVNNAVQPARVYDILFKEILVQG
jgi:flagellar FliL protein